MDGIDGKRFNNERCIFHDTYPPKTQIITQLLALSIRIHSKPKKQHNQLEQWQQ